MVKVPARGGSDNRKLVAEIKIFQDVENHYFVEYRRFRNDITYYSATYTELKEAIEDVLNQKMEHLI